MSTVCFFDGGIKKGTALHDGEGPCAKFKIEIKFGLLA